MTLILKLSVLISVVATLGACATGPATSKSRKPSANNERVVKKVGCTGWGHASADGRLLHGSVDLDFKNRTGNYLEAIDSGIELRTDGNVGVAQLSVTLNETVATDPVKATLHIQLLDNTKKDVELLVGYQTENKIEVPLGDGNVGDITCSGIMMMGRDSEAVLRWQPRSR